MLLGMAATSEPERLVRMRAALDKFLGLIDHKATYVQSSDGSAKNFARALPQLEPVAGEKARLQFLQDLKTDVRVRGVCECVC